MQKHEQESDRPKELPVILAVMFLLSGCSMAFFPQTYPDGEILVADILRFGIFATGAYVLLSREIYIFTIALFLAGLVAVSFSGPEYLFDQNIGGQIVGGYLSGAGVLMIRKSVQSYQHRPSYLQRIKRALDLIGFVLALSTMRWLLNNSHTEAWAKKRVLRWREHDKKYHRYAYGIAYEMQTDLAVKYGYPLCIVCHWTLDDPGEHGYCKEVFNAAAELCTCGHPQDQHFCDLGPCEGSGWCGCGGFTPTGTYTNSDY